MTAPLAPTIRNARHNDGGVVRLVVEGVDPATVTRYELYRDDYPTAATTLLGTITPGVVYDVTAPDQGIYNYRARAIHVAAGPVDEPSAYSNQETVKVRTVGDPSSSTPTRAKQINRAL